MNNSMVNQKEAFSELMLMQEEKFSMQRLINYESLSKVLRYSGLICVLLGLLNFLYLSWQGSSDSLRVVSLFAMNLGTVFLAFFSAKKQGSSANTSVFLFLANIANIVLVTVLSAFIYAHWLELFSLDSPVYPEYFKWQGLPLWLTVCLSIACIPLCAISSMTLFRHWFKAQSGQLTVIYLLSVLALALPIRSLLFSGLMIAGVSFSIALLWNRTRLDYCIFKTLRAKAVLVILYSPLLILVGRFSYLYNFDVLTMGVLAAAVFAILWQLHSLFIPNEKLFNFSYQYNGMHKTIDVLLNSAMFICSLVIASALYITVYDALKLADHSVAQWLAYFMAVTSGFIFTYAMASRALVAAWYLKLFSVMIFTAAHVMQLFFEHDILLTVFTLMMSFAVLLISYYLSCRFLLLSSAVLLMASLVSLSVLAINLFDMTLWWLCGLLGLLLIFVSAYTEQISQRLQLVKSSLIKNHYRFE